MWLMKESLITEKSGIDCKHRHHSTEQVTAYPTVDCTIKKREHTL